MDTDRQREMDGFGEYRRLILGELERLNMAITSLDSKIDTLRDNDISDIKIDVAMLKVKASIVGAVSGAVVALLIRLIAR